MEALQQANLVRLARAALKRDIKAGEVLAAEVLLLAEVPDWLGAMRLEEFCNAIPRFRFRTFQELTHACEIKLTATVGDLNPRRRKLLGERLAEWEADAADRRARPRRYHGKGARASA